MGYDYAFVHLQYTIPPAIVLTLLYQPLLHRIDIYKILFLATIAVVSTIPWDSYLIRRKIWTYPPGVIFGPRLFSIPAEEVFFFVIQTYNTSLIYLILSKILFHPTYLVQKTEPNQIRSQKLGQAILTICIVGGGILFWRGGESTYFGLILGWAGPFALLLWALSSQFLIALPRISTLVPIVLPTIYLWIVDTLALKRGTWSIESGTKLGIYLWDSLEIEEAIFFLATNTLIVFGLVVFDHALAILLTFPQLFPQVPELPSPVLLVKALLMDTAKYDQERVNGIQQAVARLQKKSRSFYLASSTFSGRLRIDLILLYSFCRVVDDLVDNAADEEIAYGWIKKITHYLDLAYASKEARITSKQPNLHSYIRNEFPESAQSALCLLPTNLLPFGPLYDLLEGFKTDLEFYKTSDNSKDFPIKTEHDLEIYSARVAGTVAELILELVFYHSYSKLTSRQRSRLVHSGSHMGIALQYVNIARDVATDAAIGRVYLPSSWLKEEGLTVKDALKNPKHPAIENLRMRLLAKAFSVYEDAQLAIAQLPDDVRAPMRVAVESYMEIGRVLRETEYEVEEGKATVPKLRRLRVAWKALNEG
ncbi:Squalene/phytoene synthase-domain-containing protein [Tricladium varicosporioides]|nr:Squalene/phytoene synthase-domain-containing protein [Hymenoscyphus varicosporioides]